MSMVHDGLYQWGGAPVSSNAPMDAYAGWRKQIFFVDGDDGSDGNSGRSPRSAVKTIQKAIDLVSDAGAVIYVFPLGNDALDTDPDSYTETLIIGNDTPQLSLIGVGTGLTQGGLPQIAKGSGATHLLDVRAPGCVIANLGFNGASMTTDGGASGIYLNDDGGTTYSTFGTTITGCHFKNLGRGHAGTAAAICIGSNGGSWQLRIEKNRFYNDLCGIGLNGTGVSVPQDIVISGNWFGSSANTSVDADIDLGNGSGAVGVTIDGNHFQTVDVPAHSGGAVTRYLDLTSCKGVLSNNFFACKVGESETPVTFGAAGTAALIPTTVRMAGNWGEVGTTGATNDRGEVYRT